MQRRRTLAILSDIHYAGDAERQRTRFQIEGITSPFLRFLIPMYRRHIWLRDPFAHNHLLDHFLSWTRGADYVVANGDYSCDSAFVGVSDDAACASARQCLGRLRDQFGGKFQAVLGDHEIGKRMMGGASGGPRLASLERCGSDLSLDQIWQVDFGRYALVGVTSTLLALPVFEEELLEVERAAWSELRREHLARIGMIFSRLAADRKVILFCHDPTALPFLLDVAEVRDRLPQIERTVIGHLHSPILLLKSHLLAGMPPIRFLGHTPLRLSSALSRARLWKPFKVTLCPSLAGIELLKDGGYYEVELDETGAAPAKFRLHKFGKRIRAGVES